MNKSKRWTEEQINFLKENYPKANRDVIKEYYTSCGKNMHAVEEYARRNGIKREVAQADSCRRGTLIPLLEDSAIIFYWIGFIFADGCFQKTGQLFVNQSSKDKDHLEKLASVLNTKIHLCDKSPTTIFKNIEYSRNTQHRLTCSHKDVWLKVMSKFDFKFRKTYNPPEFEKLYDALKNDPENLMCWLIGFIDGDGTPQRGGVKIEIHSSWGSFLQEVQSIISDSSFLINKRGYCSLYLYKNTVDSLLKIIQKYNLPVMERKWIN